LAFSINLLTAFKRHSFVWSFAYSLLLWGPPSPADLLFQQLFEFSLRKGNISAVELFSSQGGGLLGVVAGCLPLGDSMEHRLDHYEQLFDSSHFGGVAQSRLFILFFADVHQDVPVRGSKFFRDSSPYLGS
jgi:hypothetical protein